MEAIAICSRAPAPPAHAVVFAFFHKKDRVYVSAWPCPFCGASDHRHDKRGLQAAPCGRGEYIVKWNNGRITA